MNIFSEKLLSSLISQGIPEKTAIDFMANAENIFKGLDNFLDDDVGDIEEMSRYISKILLRHIHKGNNEITSEMIEEITPASIIPSKRGVPDTKFFVKLSKASKNKKNIISMVYPCLIFFLRILLIALDVIINIISILLMVFITVLGIVLFFVGIFYGVSQFTVFSGAAFYEIGIGLISGGISAIIVVLLYNLITVLLPRIMKRIINNLKGITERFKRFRFSLRSGGKAL